MRWPWPTLPRHARVVPNAIEVDGQFLSDKVGKYQPNPWGLHDMHGSVSEWCADWFGTEHDSTGGQDPSGPPTGTGKVMKGGSYLCHESYCNRYRVGARSSNTPDTTTGNIGFRVAWDAP